MMMSYGAIDWWDWAKSRQVLALPYSLMGMAVMMEKHLPNE